MSGFSLNHAGDVSFYTIDEFENTGKVKTCVSLRTGGVSSGQYGTLNLGYKTDDDKSNIDRNLDILCSGAGFNKSNMVISDQVHGDRCRVVYEEDRGKGIVKESDIDGIDALVTDRRNIALCIFTADCVPVFLFDERNHAIGLCHAGWRGVVNRIVPKTIDMMASHFGTVPGDLTAAVAPSIGPCCFEVGADVAVQFERTFGRSGGIIIEEKGSLRINLWNALKTQLENSGIKRNIINSGLCTYCNEDKFYSYRRDGSKTGRMVSILQLA